MQYQSSKQIKEQIAGRELAYRPNVPQGWGRPKVVLPPGKIIRILLTFYCFLLQFFSLLTYKIAFNITKQPLVK